MEGALILHSRGRTDDPPSARNADYALALHLLLERISVSKLVLEGVWVDGRHIQDLPVYDRRIYFDRDIGVEPNTLFSALSDRMAAVGRDLGGHDGRGNSTQRLRFKFSGPPSQARLIRIAGWGLTHAISDGEERLPSEELRRVSAIHVWKAVDLLLEGSVAHPFPESTHYDVITEDGNRLPPKAVFGLAASEALGFSIRPHQFSAGRRTVCFQAITDAGYSIESKAKAISISHLTINPDVRKWAEGRLRFVTHLRRERARGVVAAKKAAFRQAYGRLKCERCKLDPVEVYGGEHAEACIEVHHNNPLADSDSQRETSLHDLVCLCANCHRIVHRQLRIPSSESPTGVK